MCDAQNVALAIDVLGPDVECFGHSQAALIDNGEVGAVATVVKSPEELADFPAGEDVWQGFLALDLDLCPDFPALAEVIAIEGAQGADGLVEGGTGEFSVGLKVEQKVEDLPRTEVGKPLIGMVLSKLRHPAQVGFDGALAQPFELDETAIILIPRLRSEWVVFFAW